MVMSAASAIRKSVITGSAEMIHVHGAEMIHVHGAESRRLSRIQALQTGVLESLALLHGVENAVLKYSENEEVLNRKNIKYPENLIRFHVGALEFFQNVTVSLIYSQCRMVRLGSVESTIF
jgi:hypothetical protein